MTPTKHPLEEIANNINQISPYYEMSDGYNVLERNQKMVDSAKISWEKLTQTEKEEVMPMINGNGFFNLERYIKNKF